MAANRITIKPNTGCVNQLPAGYEIKFGSIMFQATGNGNLMRIVEERPVSDRPVTQSAPQESAQTPTTSKRKRRSGARTRRARANRRAREVADALAEVDLNDPPRPPATRRPVPRPQKARRPKADPAPRAPLPLGLRSAAAVYASSVSTNLSAYEELPGHHLMSIRDLIASTPDDSYPESAEESGWGEEDPEWDYSGLVDREAFMSFQAAADYCLTCSDDSSDGDYDPMHECFMVEVDAQDGVVESDSEEPLDGDPVAPALPQANPPLAAPVPPQANPPQVGDQRGLEAAQRTQLDELEVKLAEDQRAAQKFRIGLDGNRECRGNRACEAGRQARAHINNDHNVEDPLALNHTSQKLIAAATLLRAMPEPATPEDRNLHLQAQRLVEQAAVQQAESSASRRQHSSVVRGGGSAREDAAESARTPPRAGGSRASHHSLPQQSRAPQPNAEQPKQATSFRPKRVPVRSRLHDTCDAVNNDGGRGVPNQKEKEADARRYNS